MKAKGEKKKTSQPQRTMTSRSTESLLSKEAERQNMAGREGAGMAAQYSLLFSCGHIQKPWAERLDSLSNLSWVWLKYNLPQNYFVASFSTTV